MELDVAELANTAARAACKLQAPGIDMEVDAIFNGYGDDHSFAEEIQRLRETTSDEKSWMCEASSIFLLLTDERATGLRG